MTQWIVHAMDSVFGNGSGEEIAAGIYLLTIFGGAVVGSNRKKRRQR